MSKLAQLRQYRYSPAAGGLGAFLGPLVKFVGKGLGIIKPAATKAAQIAGTVAKSPVGQAALYAGAGAATSALMRGGKSGGSADWPFAGRRRSKGITARELRGYRKVANLLHKEGMVSKRVRGRKVC